MVDKTIRVGETLDLTYLVSDSELTNTDTVITGDIDDQNLNYKESLLWTPTINDVGNTYTLKVDGKEL